METVGELLKREREKQKKTLKEVAKNTKISLKVLEALEKNDFSSLPAATFTQGFIKNYAQELGLEPQRLLAIFRRDFRQKQSKNQPLLKLETESGFRWTPKMTVMAAIILFLLLFSGYLFFQYQHFWGQPELKVFTPVQNTELQEKRLKVEGKTDPEATVEINGEVVSLDERGNFQKEIELFEGENKILIEAISRKGKRTKIEREVYYTP